MKISAIPKKRSSIRAINEGTRYDITGNLRRLAREIERGEHGKVEDMVVAFSPMGAPNHGHSVKTFHFGTGTRGEAHFVAATATNRLEPA